jgi:hypothetical protein
MRLLLNSKRWQRDFRYSVSPIPRWDEEPLISSKNPKWWASEANCGGRDTSSCPVAARQAPVSIRNRASALASSNSALTVEILQIDRGIRRLATLSGRRRSLALTANEARPWSMKDVDSRTYAVLQELRGLDLSAFLSCVFAKNLALAYLRAWFCSSYHRKQ